MTATLGNPHPAISLPRDVGTSDLEWLGSLTPVADVQGYGIEYRILRSAEGAALCTVVGYPNGPGSVVIPTRLLSDRVTFADAMTFVTRAVLSDEAAESGPVPACPGCGARRFVYTAQAHTSILWDASGFVSCEHDNVSPDFHLDTSCDACGLALGTDGDLYYFDHGDGPVGQVPEGKRDEWAEIMAAVTGRIEADL